MWAVGPFHVLVGAVIAFGRLAASLVYLPAAVVREATWDEDEELPGWMGTVRDRRRLRVALAVVIVVLLPG